MRGWIDRPSNSLRVENLAGTVLLTWREQPGGSASASAFLEADRRLSAAEQATARAAAEATHRARARPTMRADGLVARRGSDRYDHDAPMYVNYHWVAMLDPVELTDGQDPDTGEWGLAGTTIDDLYEVTHEGRPAWEAVLRPTSAYDPRCSCCALLPSAEVDAHDGWRKRDGAYPDAFRVRLDRGTGICVLSEQLGGEYGGSGHRLAIEAVDETMGAALFG